MTKNILYCCYQLKKIKIAKYRYIGTHFGIKTRKYAPAEKKHFGFSFPFFSSYLPLLH